MSCGERCNATWHGSLMAKVQAGFGGVLVLCGAAMVVAGIVMLALDCGPSRHPWLLLVWGLITTLLYGSVMAAGIDRY